MNDDGPASLAQSEFTLNKQRCEAAVRVERSLQVAYAATPTANSTAR